MMPTVSSVALFHFSGQDDQREMQHYFFDHTIPLPPTSASSMALLHLFSQDNHNRVKHWHWHWHHMLPMASNGPISFIRPRQLKWSATSCFGHLIPLTLVSMSYHAYCIINGTTAFLRLRQLKWGAKWFFYHVMPLKSTMASYDAAGTAFCVMWYTTSLMSASCAVDSTICGTLHSLGQDDPNEVQHDFLVMWNHWHYPEIMWCQ